MKKRRYNIICFNIILILVLVPLCPGQSLLDEEQIRNQQANRHKDWGSSGQTNKQNVPYSSVANGESTTVTAADSNSLEYVKETVKGLQSADYSLGKIVETLANNGNSASTISMALLSTGSYNSQDIYNALINDGKFSLTEADTAMPAKSGTNNQISVTASLNSTTVITTTSQTTIDQIQPVSNNETLIKAASMVGTTNIQPAAALTTEEENVIRSEVQFTIDDMQAQGKSEYEIIDALVSQLNFSSQDVQIIAEEMTRAGYDTSAIEMALSKYGANKEDIEAGIYKVWNEWRNASAEELQAIAQDLYSNNKVTTANIAYAFWHAGITSTKAYDAISGITVDSTTGNTISLNDAMAGLINGGYGTQTVYTVVVTDLQRQGLNSTQIVEKLAVTAPLSKVNDKLTYSKTDIAKFVTVALLKTGRDETEIAGALSANNFTLDEIGEVFYKANVNLNNAYTALKNNNFSVKDVTNSLIKGGYDKVGTYNLAVKDYKAQGLSDAQIVETLIGTAPAAGTYDPGSYGDDSTPAVEPHYDGGVSPDEQQKWIDTNMSSSQALAIALLDNGSTSTEVMNGFSANGFNDTAVAKVMKTETAKLYQVKELQAAGYTSTQIVQTLVMASPESERMDYAVLVGKAFKNTNISAQEISGAFAANGFSVADTAKILSQSGITDTNTVYAALRNTDFSGAKPAPKDVASAMTAAGYDRWAVYSLAVNDYKQQGFSDTQIVKEFVGVETTAAQAVCAALIGSGSSVQSVTNAYAANGYSLTQTSTILKGAQVGSSDAYNALKNTSFSGSTPALVDVANALADAGYDRVTIYTYAVSDYKAQGYSDSQIVSAFIGTVPQVGVYDPGTTDSEGTVIVAAHYDNGVSPEERQEAIDSKMTVATALTQALVKNGESADSISAAFADNKYTITEVAQVMKKSGISVDAAYTAVKNTTFSGTSASTAEVANSLISAGYDKQQTYTLAVKDYKAQGLSDAQIVEKLIGTVPAVGTYDAGSYGDDSTSAVAPHYDNGVSPDEQKSWVSSKIADAQLLAAAMLTNGSSLQQVSSAFSAQGFNSENIGDILNTQGVKDIAVANLKSQGLSDSAIVGQIMAVIPANEKSEHATQIAAALKKSGSDAASTTTALAANGFSLKDTSNALKGAGFTDTTQVYSALSNTEFSGSKPSTKDITEAMVASGYSKSAVYTLAVADFKNKGTSDSQIVKDILGAGPLGDRKYDAGLLANIMINQGSGLDSVGAAFAGNGYSLQDTATAFSMAGVKLSYAYTTLKNTSFNGSAPTTETTSEALINAGYWTSSVYVIAVADYKNANTDATTIVAQLIGSVPLVGTYVPETGATDANPDGTPEHYDNGVSPEDRQKDVDAKLTDTKVLAVCMLRGGYSAAEIQAALINNNFTESEATSIVSYASSYVNTLTSPTSVTNVNTNTQQEILRNNLQVTPI